MMPFVLPAAPTFGEKLADTLTRIGGPIGQGFGQQQANKSLQNELMQYSQSPGGLSSLSPLDQIGLLHRAERAQPGLGAVLQKHLGVFGAQREEQQRQADEDAAAQEEIVKGVEQIGDIYQRYADQGFLPELLGKHSTFGPTKSIRGVAKAGDAELKQASIAFINNVEKKVAGKQISQAKFKKITTDFSPNPSDTPQVAKARAYSALIENGIDKSQARSIVEKSFPGVKFRGESLSKQPPSSKENSSSAGKATSILYPKKETKLSQQDLDIGV
jgi:hypothetical protein